MKYTLAEQIRRRNQERARQDAAAQKRTRSIPAVIYTSFDIRKADELRERIKKAEEYRKRVRAAEKPKQNQKSQETDSSRQATQTKTPSYDPLSSIRAPRTKPAPRPAAPDHSKPKKKKPAQVTDAHEPSLSGFPQDIEWQPDIDPADIFDLCGRLCEQNPQAMTSIMNFIEGFDPDDDEQTIRRRVNNHLRIIGLNDAFDRGDWYTTPIDPSLSHSAAQIADYYFDRRRASQEERPAAPTAEEALLTDNQQVLAQALEADASKLNHRTVQYLQEKFPDASLATREELQTFLQGRLAQLVPEFDDPEMEWDGLDTQELILFYYAALEVAMGMYEETTYSDFENIHNLMDEHDAIEEELNIAVDLIKKAAKTPLEDHAALLEAYGWDAEADAIYYFRHRVEVVYAKLDKQLPPEWAEVDDAVLMANMLYDGVEEMKAILESGETFLNPDDPDAGDWGEINNALLFIDTEPQILTGTNSQPDLSLFVFVASIFFEPLDWALTTLEVIDAVSRGDIGGALGNALLGIVPFVPGSADNIIRHVGGIGRVGEAAGDFASRFNRLNLSSADTFYERLRENKKYQHLPDKALWQEARNRAASSNAGKIHRQLNWAAKYDPDQWAWRVPVGDQQLHHIIPAGDPIAHQARQHMQSYGIFVNSAYNGVGLEVKVHHLTYSPDYVKAINNAIRKYDNPDKLVGFLDSVARDLHDLNRYVDNKDLLGSKFNEFLSKLSKGGNQ